MYREELYKGMIILAVCFYLTSVHWAIISSRNALMSIDNSLHGACVKVTTEASK